MSVFSPSSTFAPGPASTTPGPEGTQTSAPNIPNTSAALTAPTNPTIAAPSTPPAFPSSAASSLLSPLTSSGPSLSVFFSTPSLSSSSPVISETAAQPTTAIPPQSTSTPFPPASTNAFIPTGPADQRASTSGFFSHKGEVAGVFAVIGLVAIAIFLILVTTVVRRRRSEKFDQDVAKAAREAASMSHSTNFDGYDGVNENIYNGYSAESHGTYGQSAMSLGGHTGESYTMENVAGGAAGAAGIGTTVRTAATQIARSGGHSSGSSTAGVAGFGAGAGHADNYPVYEQRIPYAAFAIPGPQPQKIIAQAHVPGMRYQHTPGGREVDLLEAAGLGVSANISPEVGPKDGNRRPPERARLTTNKSQGGYRLVQADPGPSNNASLLPGESYVADYQSGHHPDVVRRPQRQRPRSHGQGLAPDSFQVKQAMVAPVLPNPHDPYYDDTMDSEPEGDAYGGADHHMER